MSSGRWRLWAPVVTDGVACGMTISWHDVVPLDCVDSECNGIPIKWSVYLADDGACWDCAEGGCEVRVWVEQDLGQTRSGLAHR